MIKKIVKRIVKIYYMYIRRDNVAYARHLGVEIGENSQILTDPQIAFGTEPWLIKLGSHVDVTYGVQFLNHEGGIWCARGIESKYKNMDCFAPITVGDNVMIGVHSLIMPGVHIGNNVIIAGHCVVTKDIPDGVVVAGVPAKQISTVEKFMDGMNKREIFPTKYMTSEQKKRYLKEIHPEWF
ncbi:acyltransferase [Eubacterium sp.]|uniref:acyltransferase n=1 Tax=Eubacterium sp. TaxID=142586 RepID=UPI0035218556